MEMGFLKVTSPVMVTLFWLPEKISVMAFMLIEGAGTTPDSELEMVDTIKLPDDDGSKVNKSGTLKSPSQQIRDT